MGKKKLKHKLYWYVLMSFGFVILSPFIVLGFLFLGLAWIISFPFKYPRYKKSSYPATYNEAYNNWLDFKVYETLTINKIRFERFRLNTAVDDWVYYFNDEDVVYVLIQEEIWNVGDKWFSEYSQYLENDKNIDLFESIRTLLNSIDVKKEFKLVIDSSSIEHLKKNEIKLFKENPRLINYKTFLKMLKNG